MDHGQPRAVFLVAVGFMVLTMLLALASDHGGRRRRARAAAARTRVAEATEEQR